MFEQKTAYLSAVDETKKNNSMIYISLQILKFDKLKLFLNIQAYRRIG